MKNLFKDMEAIFVVAAVLLTAASYATAAVPGYKTTPVVQSAKADTPMQVVTITGKRLTASEKAALI